MQNYILDENIVRYRKLIAISEGDPGRDEDRYQTLLRLLAEEQAKSVPFDGGLRGHSTTID